MPRRKQTIEIEISKLKEQLQDLKNRGFIVSLRGNNTGIGYTLETLLGVRENNLRGPDIGAIELKSHRRGVSNRITLFTFNRGAWRMRQRRVIEKYGYTDSVGRHALYSTVASTPNNLGLYTRIENNKLLLCHVDGTVIAEWSGHTIAGRFSVKMPNLVAVYADTRINSNSKEEGQVPRTWCKSASS